MGHYSFIGWLKDLFSCPTEHHQTDTPLPAFPFTKTPARLSCGIDATYGGGSEPEQKTFPPFSASVTLKQAARRSIGPWFPHWEGSVNWSFISIEKKVEVASTNMSCCMHEAIFSVCPVNLYILENIMSASECVRWRCEWAWETSCTPQLGGKKHTHICNLSRETSAYWLSAKIRYHSALPRGILGRKTALYSNKINNQ